jgi:glycosyltransferase involved in cell wall biosynthesis
VVIPALGREIRPWRDLRAYRAVQEHLRRNRYAIVHTHTSKAGILARLAAHRLKVPVIIHTAHGWQWTHARGGGMNTMIRASERRAARYSDRIIVVAEKDREKGLAAGVGRPEQYVLIESAIPLDEFDPGVADGARFREELGIPPGAPVAGTVGRFSFQKAPEIMLAAAMTILAREPEAHFIYVGDGPLRTQLVERISGEGRERLHLAGIRKDVPAALAAMDVFALSSRYEGLPRVVVEAMAMEMPVVTTPADGVVDVVKENTTGYIVPFEDSESLAGRILSLLKDRGQARQMGAAARPLVLERFEIGQMVRRIEDLYREVLTEKGID